MAFTKITHAGIGSTGTVLLENLEVTGVGTFGGSVSVGGTLTYEDVTNVDSIGIVTARAGVLVGSGITLSKDGDIFATGVTTSTTFVGALTGNVTGNISGGTVAGSTGTFTGDVSIPDTIVHTGDTNTKIRFPAADTFTVETAGSEAIRITSDGDLGVGMGSPWARLVVHETSSNTSLTGHNYLASQSGMSIENGSTTDGSFSAYSARVKNNAGTQQSGSLAFKSTSSGYTPEIHLTQRTGAGVQATRLLIDSSGKLLVGTSSDYAENVQAAFYGASNGGIALASGTSGSSRLMFADGTSGSGTGAYIGSIIYAHSDNSMRFTTNTSEALRIDSSGRIRQGSSTGRNTALMAASPTYQLEGVGSNASNFGIFCNSNGTAAGGLIFGKTRGTAVGGTTVVQDGDSLGHIAFEGSDGSAQRVGARITASVDGTPGSSDMPGRLMFFTTPDGSASETERMRINKDGIITKPYTPSFFVTINGGDATTNISNKIPWNVVKHNTGSHYDTSNYYFVAPVSAHYYFFVQLWAKNTTSNARFHFHVEDASNSYTGDNITQNGFHSNGLNFNDHTMSASIVWYLDVGDRISVRPDNTNLTYYTAGASDPHSYFCGYMIG